MPSVAARIDDAKTSAPYSARNPPSSSKNTLNELVRFNLIRSHQQFVEAKARSYISLYARTTEYCATWS